MKDVNGQYDYIHGHFTGNSPDYVSRESVVGTATYYGPDGPGIESRWGARFPHPSRSPLGPPSFLYKGYRASFPEVKRPGRGDDHPPPFNAEAKETVELYL